MNQWWVDENSVDYRDGLSGRSGSGASWEAGRKEMQRRGGGALLALPMLLAMAIVAAFANAGVFGGLALWLVLRKIFRIELPDRPMQAIWTAAGAFLTYCIVQVWTLRMGASEQAFDPQATSPSGVIAELQSFLDAWGLTTIYQVIPVPNVLDPRFWENAPVPALLGQLAAVLVAASVIKWSYRKTLTGFKGFAQSGVAALGAIATCLFVLSRDFVPNPLFGIGLCFFCLVVCPIAGGITKLLGGASNSGRPYDAGYSATFAGLTVCAFGGLALGFEPLSAIDHFGRVEVAMLLLCGVCIAVMLPSKPLNRLLNSVVIAATCALGWVAYQAIIVGFLSQIG